MDADVIIDVAAETDTEIGVALDSLRSGRVSPRQG